jgi:hypothetical protein
MRAKRPQARYARALRWREYQPLASNDEGEPAVKGAFPATGYLVFFGEMPS